MPLILALVFSLLFPSLSRADSIPAMPAKASLVSEFPSFSPGQAITVGLRIQRESHWHTYWQDPGDAGLPTTLEWKLPAGVKAGPLLWPKPLTFKDPGGLVGYGYLGDSLLLAEIKISKAYSAKTLPLQAKAAWLVCREVCIPGSASLSLEIPMGATAAADPAASALFSAARATLGQLPDDYKGAVGAAPRGRPQGQPEPSAPILDPNSPNQGGHGGPPLRQSLIAMLLLAFIGGLLLNLMPCVLPVLSLKVMAFVRQSGESRGRSTALGLAFNLGALVSFWILAGAVIFLRAAGETVGWGFQFQNPIFVAAMAVIVTAFALNLFGVFEISLHGPTAQGFHEAGGREGLPGAFFTGAFMTLLATPCTAPFLGTALGFAFSQGSDVLFAVFTAVGLGLAAPYMLLSANPKLMAWVPKPGKWMLHFRQFMGFLLLASLPWLLWVLGMQTGLEFVIWFLGFLLALGLAAWIYGAYAPIGSTWKRLGLVLVLDLGLLAGAYQALLADSVRELLHPESVVASLWEPYSAAKLADYAKQGRTVFLDFGADWCWTCKVNERATLDSEMVSEKMDKLKVVRMKADWTRRDPELTKLISSFGRSGVPLYVIYKSGLPLVLPEIVTPGIVLAALEKHV